MRLVDVKRYRQLSDIIAVIRPKTIIEVGTHAGGRAEAMCLEALKYRNSVHYTGYDLFEDASAATNAAEKARSALSCRPFQVSRSSL
jgi:hypothetical protein